MSTLSLVRETLINKYDAIKNMPDDLLLVALTSPNTNNKMTKYGSADYERLEFLGDAVLELIVSDIIFDEYSLKDPGELSAFKSRLVRNSTLYCMMNDKKLCNPILSKKRCADMFESILGAIYYYLKQIKYKQILEFIRLWLIIEWNFDTTIQWLLNNPNKLYCNEVVTSAEKRYAKSPKISPKESPSKIISSQKIIPSYQLSNNISSNNISSNNISSNNIFSDNISLLNVDASSQQSSNLPDYNVMSTAELTEQQRNIQRIIASRTPNKEQAYKTQLDHYMKNRYGQHPTYIQLGENNIGVMCPQGFKCPRGQMINNYHIIGVGNNKLKKKAEESAAKNTLIYFNQI